MIGYGRNMPLGWKSDAARDPGQRKDPEMFTVSEIMTTAPEQCRTPLERKVYDALRDLNIPFQRVETSEAVTMEDCRKIDAVLGMKMVKTLFLCDRKKTSFYLAVLPGDKPFSTKDFSHALQISRVSFAPKELLIPMLGTRIGAVTVFSCLLDPENRIQVVFDREVCREEFYGCSDGTTTCYLKLQTRDVTDQFLPGIHHTFRIV